MSKRVNSEDGPKGSKNFKSAVGLRRVLNELLPRMSRNIQRGAPHPKRFPHPKDPHRRQVRGLRRCSAHLSKQCGFSGQDEFSNCLHAASNHDQQLVESWGLKHLLPMFSFRLLGSNKGSTLLRRLDLLILGHRGSFGIKKYLAALSDMDVVCMCD